MAARAIWKGIVQVGGAASVRVKLYSAVQDKTIHFRLLHEKDLEPVKQRMVDAVAEEPVENEEVRKAYPVSRSNLLILDSEDLQKVEPPESRDIEITRFVDPAEIDHRWYERAYFLGPDQSNGNYFALAKALENRGKEGVARWVMRRKEYIGALRSENGYLMLITLRRAEEVVSSEELRPPAGRDLNPREVTMAEQLINALAGHFDPRDFRDEYRDRVMELVERKAAGKKPKVEKFRPRPKEASLEDALAASLAGAGKTRKASGR